MTTLSSVVLIGTGLALVCTSTPSMVTRCPAAVLTHATRCVCPAIHFPAAEAVLPG